MSSRFVKINSRQGGPFTVRQNLVDFDIPADGVYNLKNSFVNLIFNVDIVEETPGADDTSEVGIYNAYVFYYGTNTTEVSNSVLVKNCMLNTRKNGIIENVRRNDVLKETLEYFTKSEEQDDSEQYYQNKTELNNNAVVVGQMAELHGYGNIKSVQRPFPVRIDMSTLFELGNVQMFPTDKTGIVRVHLELNLDNLQLVEATELSIEDFENIEAGDPKNIIVADKDIYNPLNNEFYVGQKLEVVYDLSGTSTTKKRVITSIDFNEDGFLRLTLDSQLEDASTELTDIQVSKVGFESATVSVVNAEIVLEKVMNATNVPSVINYRTFTTEEAVYSGSSLKRIFEVEPEAVNLLVVALDQSSNVPVPLNFADSGYRIAVDNQLTTNRDVLPFTTLYKDRLIMTFLNMGKVLRNLLNVVKKVDKPTINNPNDLEQAFMIAQPLPETQKIKLVQVETNNSTSQNLNLYLFKQVKRTINF